MAVTPARSLFSHQASPQVSCRPVPLPASLQPTLAFLWLELVGDEALSGQTLPKPGSRKRSPSPAFLVIWLNSWPCASREGANDRCSQFVPISLLQHRLCSPRTWVCAAGFLQGLDPKLDGWARSREGKGQIPDVVELLVKAPGQFPVGKKHLQSCYHNICRLYVYGFRMQRDSSNYERNARKQRCACCTSSTLPTSLAGFGWTVQLQGTELTAEQKQLGI